MKKNLHHWILIFCCMLGAVANGNSETGDQEVDVCVYGGTASGICAALAVKARGQSVIIVEPMRHLGGIAGGGISIGWDCMFKDDIGGISKELHDVSSLNQWEERQMLEKKVKDADIPYFTEYRLDGKDDVVMGGNRIQKIYLNYAPIMDEGVPPPQPQKRHRFSVKAKVFIDASYEGDLMAFSGVRYAVGREAISKYNESLAGQRGLKVYDEDPYIEKGNPASGLLPMISEEPYEEGAASRYIMAYNYRLIGFRGGKKGSDSAERTPMKKLGREIDKDKYALVIRSLSHGGKWPIGYPNWNYLRGSMVTSSIPGRQADYPDGSWAVRSEYCRELIDHIKTMNILTKAEDKALIKGFYPDNDDFPDQLYIRLGRRMLGQYVMTQNDLMFQTKIKDSIGVAYYGVDLYPARLLNYNGKVAAEGATFVRVSPGPYPISYRALTPKKEEADNLLVSVCMSASHVAMSSIRMESGYVVMGEAAGIAASHAVKSGKAVQDVNMDAVRSDMKEVGVITEWDGEGYGPKSKHHWPLNAIYWKMHPEDYKIPLQLDPSWDNE